MVSECGSPQGIALWNLDQQCALSGREAFPSPARESATAVFDGAEGGWEDAFAGDFSISNPVCEGHMALPAIMSSHLLPLGALAPVGVPTGAPPQPAAATGGAANAFPFVMHLQLQSNWCWSAVGVSVAQYFNPATQWTSQCRLASQELGVDCCPAGSNNGTCNVPWYLDRSLTRVGHYRTFASGSLPMATIRSEVDAGRPLGVRIGWEGGGGHFVVISGYADGLGEPYVTIEDPIYEQSVLPLTAFRDRYQGTGRWSHSFWTQ